MEKKMAADNSFNSLDAMIDAYAAVSAYVEHVPELEQQITDAYITASKSEPEFDSYNSLLGRGVSHKENWSRQVAWASQHLLGSRAYCVGNYVLIKRGGKYHSPLIKQLELLGWKSNLGSISKGFYQEFQESGAVKRVDALVVDKGQSTIYIVAGYQFEAASIKGKQVDDLPLFRENPDIEREFHIAARRSLTRCVLLTHDLLRAAFPQCRIVPVIAAIDEIYSGLNQVVIDISPIAVRESRKEAKEHSSHSLISLGACPILNPCKLRNNRFPDRIRFLPDWPVSDKLNLLPIDRATRCLMLLSLLWRRQKNVVDKLVTMRAVLLGKEIEKVYGVSYPEDLRRHDLEDCLERTGLIERPAFEGNAFALTPRGVARVLMSRRILTGQTDLETDEDLCTHVLHHIHNHAEIWAAYRRGNSSIAQ